jgi:threonine dehydrogenase-like Zn-dependent dehydrogenase
MLGRVERLGAGVRTDFAGRPLHEGDRVVCTYFRGCRKCRACRRGAFNVCEFGLSQWVKPPDESPHFHGTWGTYYNIDPDQYVFRVPESIPDTVASVANCALAQVYYGIEVAGLLPGETLAVQGAGGLGLCAIAVAKERGARVICIDGVASRIDAARRFGADDIVDLRELQEAEARVRRVLDLTDGYGADAALEVTGVPSAIQEGVAMTRPTGRYVTIGNIWPGLMTPFDPGTLNRRMVTIYPLMRYLPWKLFDALQFLERTIDRFPWELLIDRDFPFERASEALELSERRLLNRGSLVMEPA